MKPIVSRSAHCNDMIIKMTYAMIHDMLHNMIYDNVTAYYTSGTGNSFRAASWLADGFAATGASTALVPVDNATPKKQPLFNDRQLVGVYHPAHGLMPPWSMLRFLLFRLPRGKGAHGVVVVTRGGIPVPKVVIPGGSGFALYFPLLILLLKGYRIRGALGLDMPCNMINAHWGITAQNVERMLSRANKRHGQLCNGLLNGRHWYKPLNLLWELLWCIPFTFFPLFPIIYLTIGRVFMAKLMFVDSSCKHCGACARHCPREAIKMVGTKSPKPFWTWRCEVCMRCMGYCRHKSIQASHLWAVAAGFGTSLLSAEYVQQAISRFWDHTPHWESILSESLSLALVFFALPLIYYLFWGLQKLPPVQWLFTYTTFTRLYRRRYHEPGTRVKDLARGKETIVGKNEEKR